MMRLALAFAVLATVLLGGCSRAPEGGTRKTQRVTGTVLEQLDGPPYSYLRLKTDAGEIWAAVPTASVAKNQSVTVVDGVLLRDFDTGIPGRRLDVVFGALDGR